MKLLVSDYDETFSFGNRIQSNIKAVERWQKSGNLFVIATGRTYEDFIERFEIHNRIPYDYLIINHGATILDQKGNVLFYKTIPGEVTKQLRREFPELFGRFKNFYSSILKRPVSLDRNDITKIHLACDSLNLARDYAARINEKYGLDVYAIPISRSGSIELIPSDINKATAIQILAQHLNIPANNIYTIGDDYNDKEMLMEFHGASMVSANEEIHKLTGLHFQSVADYIVYLLER